ncbi:hypothetical protein DXG03_002167 [Asterophora parasitica]|uniref:Uncharacterized protein n=1 Tax=Asterophora parasitica TaxID=117018 RepID=A0A9P7GCG3_9AGAR|nr:hypothetical protein DXG03_002167 [Asterophora parasitica]
MAPRVPVDVDAFYPQILHRLVESGEWDRYVLSSAWEFTESETQCSIRAILAVKLSESGWFDDLLHRSKERARLMDPLSFKILMEEFGGSNAQSQSLLPLAGAARSLSESIFYLASLPLAVKREVMVQIRQYVEKQFA